MRITVQASSAGRPTAPVVARIPMQRVDDERMMGLVDVDSGKPIPVQVDSRARLCWLQNELQPGERRIYRLQSSGFLADAARVVVRENPDGSADISEGDTTVVRYVSDDSAHRPILGPILSPVGHQVTVGGGIAGGDGDAPQAQHACWSGWGDVNGVDHWSESPTAGRQRHRRFTLSSSGPVFGRVSALIDWLNPHGEPQLSEQRVVNVFAAAGGFRIIDITSRLVMAYGQVTFGDTTHGGLCAVRVTPQLAVRGGGMVRNANGDQGVEDCRGASAAWCDCTGQIEDRFVGVSLIDCPSNVSYPTFWNVDADGLIAANPFGVSSFLGEDAGGGTRTFERDEVAMFRYRMVVHDSAPTADEIMRLSECFTQSLEIHVD
jgi:hypothetical protein